jgi:TPR repeat protein
VQNHRLAVDWYRSAAEQGNATAQYNLGAKYANGEGVKRDYVRAHMWWNLAASRGNYNAPYSREKIENEMTTQQVQTARRLAVECEARRFRDC